MLPVKLMSPAGSLEGAALALDNGADALYAGVTNLSMRPKRVEFKETNLKSLVDLVHQRGKEIYITMNVCPKPADVDLYKQKLAEVYQAGADAVIVSDVGMMAYIKQTYPDLPVHVSIMTSVVNSEAARFYKDQGAAVVVVSRSLSSIDEVRAITQNVDVDIELFIHGGICYMFDGNCYMSSYWRQVWEFDPDLGQERLKGQNNTKGECQLICKRHCVLTKDGQEIVAGRLLRRPDDVGLDRLPEYIKMGVKIFKIEGRAMPLKYIAEATCLYREAIDTYFADPSRYQIKQEWLPVVDRLIEHRLEYERTWHIT